jgi:hypothetical protein
LHTNFCQTDTPPNLPEGYIEGYPS